MWVRKDKKKQGCGGNEPDEKTGEAEGGKQRQQEKGIYSPKQQTPTVKRGLRA